MGPARWRTRSRQTRGATPCGRSEVSGGSQPAPRLPAHDGAHHAPRPAGSAEKRVPVPCRDTRLGPSDRDRGTGGLPKGERRWGREDTRKPDCALCPRTRAGCVRGLPAASCRTYLARNHPTHLPARRISPKACKRPKAETPTGEQKALSVEGGKPGSGRRPPVPMGPARQRSARATWGGTPLHSTPPSPLNAPGGSSERNTTHCSAASLPVPAHTRRLPRNGAL